MGQSLAAGLAPLWVLLVANAPPQGAAQAHVGNSSGSLASSLNETWEAHIGWRGVLIPTKVEIASVNYHPMCDTRSRQFQMNNKAYLQHTDIPMYNEASYLGLLKCLFEMLKLLIPLLLPPQIPIPDPTEWKLARGPTLPGNAALLSEEHKVGGEFAYHIDTNSMKNASFILRRCRSNHLEHEGVVCLHMEPSMYHISLEDLEFGAMLLYPKAPPPISGKMASMEIELMDLLYVDSGGGRALFGGMPIYIDFRQVKWHPTKGGTLKAQYTMRQTVGDEWQWELEENKGPGMPPAKYKLKKEKGKENALNVMLASNHEMKWTLRPFTGFIVDDDFVEDEFKALLQLQDVGVTSNDGLDQVFWYSHRDLGRGLAEEVESARRKCVEEDVVNLGPGEVNKTRMLMRNIARKQLDVEAERSTLALCCYRHQDESDESAGASLCGCLCANLCPHLLEGRHREKILRYAEHRLSMPAKMLGSVSLPFSHRVTIVIFVAQTLLYSFDMVVFTYFARPKAIQSFSLAWFWLTFRSEMLYPVLLAYLRGLVTIYRLYCFFRETGGLCRKQHAGLEGEIPVRFPMYACVFVGLAAGLPMLILHLPALCVALLVTFPIFMAQLAVLRGCLTWWPRFTSCEELVKSLIEDIEAIHYPLARFSLFIPLVVSPWIVSHLFYYFSRDTYLCTFSHMSIYSVTVTGSIRDTLSYFLIIVMVTVALLCCSHLWGCEVLTQVASPRTVLQIWLRSPFKVTLFRNQTELRSNAAWLLEMAKDNKLADIRRRHLLTLKHREWQDMEHEKDIYVNERSRLTDVQP